MGLYRVYIRETRHVCLFFHLEPKDTSKPRCSATAKAPLVSSPGGRKNAQRNANRVGWLMRRVHVKDTFLSFLPKIGARRLMTVKYRLFKTATKRLTVCCFEPPPFSITAHSEGRNEKQQKTQTFFFLLFFFLAQKTDLHFQQPGRQTFCNEDILVSFTSLCSCWRNSKLFVRDRSRERRENSGQTFFSFFFLFFSLPKPSD